jgi:hypothetical protein
MRATASTKTKTETATSVMPFASAAKISVRRNPNVRCGPAGRDAIHAANSARPIAPTSAST